MRNVHTRSADADTFRALVAPHLVAMGRLASRLSTADERDRVVIAALAVAAREHATYDETTRSVQSWLLAIIADRARRHRRRLRSASMELIDLPPAAFEFDRWGDLDNEIASLPWELRLSAELFYVLGLEVAECAAVMGCDEETVTSRLAAARRRLLDGVEEIELS